MIPEALEPFSAVFIVSMIGAFCGFPNNIFLMVRAAIIGAACGVGASFFLGGSDDLMPLAVGMFCSLNSSFFEPLVIKGLQQLLKQVI